MALFCLLSLLVVSAFAQSSQDPYQNFCRRYGHQAAVLDRRIYIDGGWVYTSPISASTLSMNQGLLYGDLNHNNGEMPMVYANLTKNSTVPDVAGGILWADEVNKILWLYGGESPAAPNNIQLWGYDVLLNQWNMSTAPSDASPPVARVSYGAGTTLNGSGQGFYYGGYQNKFTSPSWTGAQYASNNLIVYDFDHDIMKNVTGPVDGIGRAEGAMVSIPASSSGMLVYFGGVQFPNGSTVESPQSMDEIILYDLGDEKWYTQKATGQIPPNRRLFGAGVAWPDDRSSYNIYLYGGLGFAENATGFDDVYILTLPSFEWIKWYPDDSDGQSSPHGSLTCTVIENSQMIVMGGNFSYSNTQCDAPEVLGFHNLNLGQNDPTQAKWYPFQPNLTTYSVPSDIISVAGGSSTGGATQASPTAGWDDRALPVYFGEKAQFSARTPTRALPSATASSNHGSVSGGSIPAIVGGAVGGVILIIAAVLIFWWFRRQGRKAQAQTTNITSNASSQHARSELAGASTYNEKDRSVRSQLLSVSSNPQSPVLLPNSTMQHGPTTTLPVYAYQQGYQPNDPVYQQYPPHLSPQYGSPPHYPMYGYPQYFSATTSPPPGWIPHPSNQYFPPPDPRGSPPPVQEMPTVMTPSPHSRQLSFNSDNDRIDRYPSPTQDPGSGNPPIRRKEVGHFSPSETTATHTSDAGSVHG